MDTISKTSANYFKARDLDLTLWGEDQDLAVWGADDNTPLVVIHFTEDTGSYSTWFDYKKNKLNICAIDTDKQLRSWLKDNLATITG